MLDLIYKGNKRDGKIRSARLMLERVYVREYSHRSWQKKLRSQEVRSMINVTYCLIHPKAIFKKLLVYSRVSG